MKKLVFILTLLGAVSVQAAPTVTASRGWVTEQDKALSNNVLNVAKDTYRKISDSYTKSQVYTKTEIDNQGAAALITVSNMTESVIADKVTAKAADPVETAEPEIFSLTVKPNSVNTILPTTMLKEGCELEVICSGERNYKVFLPAEPEVLIGLPITVEAGLPEGMTVAYATKKIINRLPARVICEQPYSKLAVLTATELDTTSDWTPVITNMCIVCSNAVPAGGFGISPKFVTAGEHALEGRCLNAGTEFKVAYPVEGGVSTNDLMTTTASLGFMSGTFYYYTSRVSLAPSGMLFDTVGSKLVSWFEIIYKTVNGAAEVKRYTVEFE